MAHVIKTMADTLPNDPWHAYFAVPAWLQALVGKGALGAKTGAGFYTKRGKDILVLDLAAQDYVPSAGDLDPDVAALLKERDPSKKFAALRASEHPQAQFLWACFRDTFHYSAYHLADIADTARDVDFAIRWGYGWSLGPFETWQAAGWKQVADWIAEDIVAGKAMSNAPLPDWVFDGRDGVHAPNGSYSPCAQCDRAALGQPRVRAPALPRCAHRREVLAGPHGVRERRRAHVGGRRRRHRGGRLQDQDADGQRPGDGGSAGSGGHRRTRLPRPGDLAAEGALLRRRGSRRCARPVAGGRRQGLRSDGRELPGDQPAHQVFARAGGRRGAWPCPRAAVANSRCTRRAACSRWRATSAWWKPAWACCPRAAA
jgi:hypothetical protein